MMKDERLKDSTLDDTADIYKKREYGSEKEKWNSLTGKEKWEHFNLYYRNKLIASLVVIAFFVYLIVTMLAPRVETKLFVAVINHSISQDNVGIVKEEFADILQVEDKKSLEFVVDNGFVTTSSGEYSEFTAGNETKIATYLLAGDLDIMIVSQQDFEQYAFQGSYLKLADVLPSDMMAELANEFVDADVNIGSDLLDEGEVADTETGTYGISLKNVKAIDISNQRIQDPILAIVANSSKTENAIEFIRYLFELK